MMSKFLYARAGILFVCLALAACSPETKRNGEVSDENKSPASPVSAQADSPSSESNPAPPPVAPIRTPKRVASGAVTESRGTWNSVVQKITYVSSADNTRQPMMFYKPQANEPRPLLVGLHSWSEDYQQEESVIYAEWSIANDWIFIHPNFRGPNKTPQTTGSELVIGDVMRAIDYAKKNARVDERRIYAVGWSGGGYLGLLLAGRKPEIWAGTSAWVPISDLNAWYEESRRLATKYAGEIAASCGGSPAGESPAGRECRKRSPLSYLEQARAVPIDINHGIHDGHGKNSVPISQSLRAFNALASPQDRFTEDDIEYFTREAKVPPHLRSEAPEASPGGLKILFRRRSANARISVFDGGHEKNTEDAVRWLNQQNKGERFGQGS
jgi:poly(3-hydroxybutyrate) depolymerase